MTTSQVLCSKGLRKVDGVELVRLLVVDNVWIGFGDYIVSSAGVEKVFEHLKVRGQRSFLKGPKWVCWAYFGGEGGIGMLLHEKVDYLHSRTFVNAIHLTRHLKGREEAQNSYLVRTVKYFWLLLDLKSRYYFSDVPRHIVVVMLRLVGQATSVMVPGDLSICVN